MTRYLMAGLAMTASVVLLFLASFRAPHPVVPVRVEDAAALAGASAPESVPSAGSGASEANSPEAVSALQDEIRRAAQALASLENQVTQTREDLANLRSQGKPQDQPGKPASVPPVAAGPRSDNFGAAQGTSARPPAAPSSVPASQPGVQASASQRAGSSEPDRAPWPGRSDKGVATQPFGFAARPRPAEPRQPDPRATSSAGDPQPSSDEAVQAAMTRVRRQASPSAPEQPRGPTGSPAGDSGTGPHRIPTIERLQDARAAVVEGRIEDARRFLQAAQVQLVFRPVGPGQDTPRASQAAGPVAQALMALGYGDRGRALVAIDQAAGVLDPDGGVQQYGALPQTGMAPVSGYVRGP